MVFVTAALPGVSVMEFPCDADSARIVEAPVFRPTEQQFQDPLAYIADIRAQAEPYGLCRIVPPSTWKVGF